MITSPDGGILASGSGKTIQLWDLKTNKLKRSLTSHTDWITALASSPDGNILASSSLDQTIKLWNFKTGDLLTTWQAGSTTALVFSPDSKTLASGNRLVSLKGCKTPNRIQLWDLDSGEAKFSINSGLVNALAFSPDGRFLAAGAKETTVWQLPDATLLYRVASNEVNDLLFSRDGKWLITGSDGVKGEDGMKFWQAESGQLIRVIDSVATDLAINPNGNLLATTYGGITNLWRIKPLGYLGTLRGSQYSGMLVEFGLNGQAVITGSSDGLRVWLPENLRTVDEKVRVSE
jgi:WD40 repeat protein